MEKSRLNENREDTPKSKRSALKICLEALIFIIAAAVIIVLVPRYLLGRVSVKGQSMQNTLQDGDQLLGERITGYTGNYERFDIVFFHPHGKDVDEVYIKRIIGLPGERVRIEDGVIYINDAPLSESFGKEPIEDPGLARETVQLGSDEYFVMGDNRNHSTDSRDSSVGNVKKSNIDGVAVFRIWPLSRFGFPD